LDNNASEAEIEKALQIKPCNAKKHEHAAGTIMPTDSTQLFFISLLVFFFDLNVNHLALLYATKEISDIDGHELSYLEQLQRAACECQVIKKLFENAMDSGYEMTRDRPGFEETYDLNVHDSDKLRKVFVFTVLQLFMHSSSKSRTTPSREEGAHLESAT